jgi:hypothetical protein
MFEFFTVHHDVAGTNTIFALTFLSAAVYLLSFISDRIASGHWHDASRIMLGFAIMSVGVSIRTGFWVPWRAYLAHGDRQGAVWYNQFAWLGNWSALLLALVGLYIMLFPSMKRMFGRWYLLFVFACPALFYGLGVLLAEYLV